MSDGEPAHHPTAVSRRAFLQSTAMATVAGAAAPTLLHAADKSGDKLPLVGEGAHRYEVVHGWGELPESVVWGETHGVAIDKDGLIYVKHRRDNR